MSIEISGINNLIKKLDAISNVPTEKILKDISKDVEIELRAKAATISEEQANYIGECETRKYEHSCFIDIGLRNDNVSFELWKGLWYQNWGYFNYGLNFTGQYYISSHQLWFNETVKNIEAPIKKKIKAQLALEIRKEWDK